jgi:hypothetical protein
MTLTRIVSICLVLMILIGAGIGTYFFIKSKTTATTAEEKTILTPIKYTTVPGLDLPGNDISNTTNTTATACPTLCAANGQCVAAVFDSSKNTCYLKNKLSTPLVNSGTTSYVPTGTTNLTGVNFGGNDIQSRVSPSVADCRAYYQSTPKAVGAIFNGTNCWVKSEFGSGGNDQTSTLVV